MHLERRVVTLLDCEVCRDGSAHGQRPLSICMTQLLKPDDVVFSQKRLQGACSASTPLYVLYLTSCW